MRPTSLNILGKTYQVVYCDKPSDVDPRGHEALFGMVDTWTNEIRIYTGTSEHEIFDSIIHEVLHAITRNLKINTITKANDQEDVVSLLALGLSDFLVRNDWLRDREE